MSSNEVVAVTKREEFGAYRIVASANGRQRGGALGRLITLFSLSRSSRASPPMIPP